jgi:hypothetical protein
MMKKEAGNPRFPIWLLADSEPNRWRDHLDDPLDKRHPIRHNIWTSVLDVIQGKVYLALGERLDADQMYVRNAVQDPTTKPSEPFNRTLPWHDGAQGSLAEYQCLLAEYKPQVVITFGWFAFAFAMRATGDNDNGLTASGSQTAHLGNEFRKRVQAFDIARTNVLPLLHRSIAGGNFFSGHDEFCGKKGANYFEEAGRDIAGILIRHHKQLDCWVKRLAGPVAGT